jgi:ribonuclease HI
VLPFLSILHLFFLWPMLLYGYMLVMQAHAQYQSVIAGSAAPGHTASPAKPPAQAFGLRGSHAPESGALIATEVDTNSSDGDSLPTLASSALSPPQQSGKRLAELEAAIAALSAQSQARAVALEASKSDSVQRLAQVQQLEARLADAEQVSLDKSLQLAAKEAEVWRLLRAMADHVTQAPGDGDDDEGGAAAVWESEHDEEGSGLQALLDATTRDKAEAEARVQALEEEVFELRVTVAKLSHHESLRPEEAAGHASFVATLAREVSRSRERTRDGSYNSDVTPTEVNEEWFGGAFV